MSELRQAMEMAGVVPWSQDAPLADTTSYKAVFHVRFRNGAVRQITEDEIHAWQDEIDRKRKRIARLGGNPDVFMLGWAYEFFVKLREEHEITQLKST
jgi:CelD/BcsL family acetyltransferase involved in cellulose biosynthesis